MLGDKVGVFIVGLGYTVMLNVFGVPEQFPILGVTVIVATLLLVPELAAVNEGVYAVAPEAAKPTEVLLLLHW